MPRPSWTAASTGLPPEMRDGILRGFNDSTLDQAGPVGSKNQQMRVLGEMNDLGQQQEQITREGAAKISVL